MRSIETFFEIGSDQGIHYIAKIFELLIYDVVKVLLFIIGISS